MIQFLIDAVYRWRATRRRIFFYRAGRKVRHVDPVIITNLLDDIEPAWESLLGKLAYQIPKNVGEAQRILAEMARREAAKRLVEVARQVFDLPAIDHQGHGATEAEVIATMTQFIDFLWRLANATVPFGAANESASIPAGG